MVQSWFLILSCVAYQERNEVEVRCPSFAPRSMSINCDEIRARRRRGGDDKVACNFKGTERSFCALKWSIIGWGKRKVFSCRHRKWHILGTFSGVLSFAGGAYAVAAGVVTLPKSQLFLVPRGHVECIVDLFLYYVDIYPSQNEALYHRH